MNFRVVIMGLTCAALLACKGGSESYEAATDSVSVAAVPEMASENSEAASSAPSVGTTSKLPANKKFVRTAQMNFDVENVERATQQIESKVSMRKGYVTRSELHSSPQNEKTVGFSSDTLEQITSYNISTSMTIRVPNEQLDSLLADIAAVSRFLHYRIVKADDVTVQYFSASKKSQNLKAAQQKLDDAAQNSNYKAGDVLNSTQQSLNWANDEVDQKANTMSLDDQISYSTVELEFAQPSFVKRVRIPNQSLDDYRPAFTYELVDALKTSVQIVKALFLFFVRIWPIMALVAAFVWLIVWLPKRKKK